MTVLSIPLCTLTLKIVDFQLNKNQLSIHKGMQYVLAAIESVAKILAKDLLVMHCDT